MDKEKHLETALRWVNDPNVTRHLAIGQRPMTRQDEEAWFDNVGKSPTEVSFAIETLDGTHIGQSGIHRIHWVNRNAVSGSFIGDPDLRGQGYGTEAAILRSRYAFETMNLRQLFSEYLEGNNASRKMQEKVGYKQYGNRPETTFKDGRYLDVIETVLTRENFRVLWPGDKLP